MKWRYGVEQWRMLFWSKFAFGEPQSLTAYKRVYRRYAFLKTPKIHENTEWGQNRRAWNDQEIENKTENECDIRVGIYKIRVKSVVITSRSMFSMDTFRRVPESVRHINGRGKHGSQVESSRIVWWWPLSPSRNRNKDGPRKSHVNKLSASE